MQITWTGAASANFKAGRAGFQPEAIVIHVMQGRLSGADCWFHDPRAKVSAHYGVGGDGRIHQYVKEVDTAFHAGVVDQPSWPLLKPGVNPNYYTIGVEHEGRAGERWPEAQLQASLELTASIADRWGIARDNLHIVPHQTIRQSRACPGDAFDLDDYVRRLAQLEAPAAAPEQRLRRRLTLAVLALARVRSAPSTASRVSRVLPVGSSFVASAWAPAGEIVQGDSAWYRDAAGGYLWAGATDRPRGP
jgi:N-acetyl-anhydromuramyl-L-alanine amidase AmpD